MTTGSRSPTEESAAAAAASSSDVAAAVIFDDADSQSAALGNFPLNCDSKIDAIHRAAVEALSAAGESIREHPRHSSFLAVVFRTTPVVAVVVAAVAADV